MGPISICEMLPLMTKEHSKARLPNTIPSGIHGIHTPQSFTVCSLFIASQCLLMFLSPLGYLWCFSLYILSFSFLVIFPWSIFVSFSECSNNNMSVGLIPPMLCTYCSTLFSSSISCISLPLPLVPICLH